MRAGQNPGKKLNRVKQAKKGGKRRRSIATPFRAQLLLVVGHIAKHHRLLAELAGLVGKRTRLQEEMR
jgi:hypothetical protein